MLRRFATVFVLLSVANQSLWSNASSSGIVLHRHGLLGLHAHVLSIADDPEDAANSSNWGHDGAQVAEPRQYGGVTIVLFIPTLEAPPNDERVAMEPNSTVGGAADTAVQPDPNAPTWFGRIELAGALNRMLGRRLGLSGLVQTSHTLTI